MDDRSRLQRPQSAVWNSALVVAVAAAVLYLLCADEYLANPRLQAQGWRLAYWPTLATTFGLALWISWHLSTRRLLSLLVCGAAIGAVAQWVLVSAELVHYYGSWAFAVPNWALGSVAIYGLIFIVDLGLHRLRLNTPNVPRWLNCAIVLALFTLVVYLVKGEYAIKAFRHWPFWAYYGALFAGALVFAYHLRLGRLLAIVITACLCGALGEHTGGVLSVLDGQVSLWQFLPPQSHLSTSPWFWLFHGESPPLFLILTVWPLEHLCVYSLSALLADRFGGKLPLDRLGDVLYRLLRRTPELGETWVVGTSMALLGLLVWEGQAQRALWMAALLAVAIPACALIASRMFWTRAIGMVVLGGGCGLGVAAATHFAGVWVYAEPQRYGATHTTFLFAAPLWALGMLLVCGVARFVHRLVWDLFRRPQEARGEPSAALRNVTLVVALYLPVATIIHWSSPAAGEWTWSFVALAAVLLGAFLVFIVWLRRLMTGLHVSISVLFAVGLGMLLMLLQQADGMLLRPRHLILAMALAAVGSTLAFLFSYCGSAHFAEEPLTKIMRRRLRKRGQEACNYEPRVHEGDPLPRVAVCHGADYATAREAVAAALAEAEPDLTEKVAGKTVFLKPNLMVQAFSPYCVDAEVLDEVVKACLDAGAAKVQVGETSISDTTSYQALVTTGLTDFLVHEPDGNGGVRKREKVEVLPLDECEFTSVTLADSTGTAVFTQMLLPTALLNADYYLDLAQLKSHVLCEATLGIKNSLGLIPDHEKCRDHDCKLHQKLVDITKARVPDLTIIAGWQAVEGDGPWMGDRVDLQTMIASKDVVAADSVAGRIMGYDDPLADPAPGQKSCDVRIETTFLAHQQKLGRAMPPGADTALDKKIAAVVADLKQRRGAPFRKRVLNDDCFYQNQPIWGPVRILSGDPEDFGCTTYMTLLMSFLQPTFAHVFGKELDRLRDWVFVCGPLKEPVFAEGALLFGDNAIKSEGLVYARRLFHMPGNPPNQFVDGFERIGAEMDLDLVSFIAQALKETKGEYL